MKYIKTYERVLTEDEKRLKNLANRITYHLQKFFGKNKASAYSYYPEIIISINFVSNWLDKTEDLYAKWSIWVDEIEKFTQEFFSIQFHRNNRDLGRSFRLDEQQSEQLLTFLKSKKLDELFDDYLMKKNMDKYNL